MLKKNIIMIFIGIIFIIGSYNVCYGVTYKDGIIDFSQDNQIIAYIHSSVEEDGDSDDENYDNYIIENTRKNVLKSMKSIFNYEGNTLNTIMEIKTNVYIVEGLDSNSDSCRIRIRRSTNIRKP